MKDVMHNVFDTLIKDFKSQLQIKFNEKFIRMDEEETVNFINARYSIHVTPMVHRMQLNSVTVEHGEELIIDRVLNYLPIGVKSSIIGKLESENDVWQEKIDNNKKRINEYKKQIDETINEE